MPVTMSGTTITFNDNTKLVTAPKVYQTAVYVGATSSFTVPAGVTELLLIIFGGGGGGATGSATFGDTPANYIGGNGGLGGLAIKTLAVTPATSLSITIGAGGNGNNAGNGGAGGTTSVVYSGTTYSASGGGGGGSAGSFSNGSNAGNGVGSNGDINLSAFFVSSNVSLLALLAGFPTPIASGIQQLLYKSDLRGSAATALAWTTSVAFLSGARGRGELGQSGDVGGGVGGAVFIYH